MGNNLERRIAQLEAAARLRAMRQYPPLFAILWPGHGDPEHIDASGNMVAKGKERLHVNGKVVSEKQWNDMLERRAAATQGRQVPPSVIITFVEPPPRLAESEPWPPDEPKPSKKRKGGADK